MNDEPSDSDLDKLLGAFASQHAGEVSEARVRAVLEHVWDSHPLREQILELGSYGATFSMNPVEDEKVEIWLGFGERPGRKTSGRGVMLGTFALAELKSPPQG